MPSASGSRFLGGLVIVGLGFVPTMAGVALTATGNLVGVPVALLSGGFFLFGTYLTVLGAARLDR
jgi:hypothetical protein